MNTIPQGTLLFPKQPFTAKSGRSTINAMPGQSFWVVTPEYRQAATGQVEIARSNKPMGSGWHFTLEDVHTYFQVPEILSGIAEQSGEVASPVG